MKLFNRLQEALGIGFLWRSIQGIYFNRRYPEYNLFKALALKSGLPGAKEFVFSTGGRQVRILPYGQHLDRHGSHINDLPSLRQDFEGLEGKISWIRKNKLIDDKYLSEFVEEGPIRIHFLPGAGCLAAGGGRNRLMTLMRLGYRSAKQLREAKWEEDKKRYVSGDIVINFPGKPVWDDIPPGTRVQGWVDKTGRWQDAYDQGLRLTMGEIYRAIFSK